MAVFLRQKTYWYEMWFAGRRIRESSKSSSKTVAKNAEKARRTELENAFNNIQDVRHERIRTVREIAAEYLESYRLRNPRSATFAEYALKHVSRLIGSKMLADCTETAIRTYQDERLKEIAAPKTINDEVGLLLRILGKQGDFIRVELRRSKRLKLQVGPPIGKAYTIEEKARMLKCARASRSTHIYLAVLISLNTGLRDAELKQLTWAQIDFKKGYLTVGKSKTEAGEGRTIPLNSAVLRALAEYILSYEAIFGQPRPEWYVFPFGKPTPSDPTRHVTTLKTAWNTVRKAAQVEGRWHDQRHTAITDLSESGAGDQTIMDIAGHVSKSMLRHYSHIRMEAKRKALESLVVKPTPSKSPRESTRGRKRVRGRRRRA
jgi:integrase